MKFVLSLVVLALAVCAQASVIPLVPSVVGVSPLIDGATLGDIHGRLDDIHGAWDDVHGAIDAARGNSAGLPVVNPVVWGHPGWPIASPALIHGPVIHAI